MKSHLEIAKNESKRHLEKEHLIMSMTKAFDEGHEILYLDETVFGQVHQPMTTWSNRKEHVKINYITKWVVSIPVICVMG